MKKKDVFSYFMLFPAFIVSLIFIVYPMILSFIYSLQYYKLTDLSNKKFIGFKNFKEILFKQDFYEAIINTLVIVIVVLILGIIISFLEAILLNYESKVSKFLMGVAIIPWALPPVVNGVIWKFIFYPEFGLVNKIGYLFNLTNEPILWLNNRVISLIIFGIIVSWRTIPFSALLLLANIKAIPDEIFEAAQIDGADKKSIIKDILIPILIPTFTIIIINLVLTGINTFDEVSALVGFRSLGETFMIYNYKESFQFLNIGKGSAITYILTLFIGIIGLLYIKIFKERKENERKNQIFN